MDKKEIKLIFDYEGVKTELIVCRNEKIKDVCEKFAKQRNIDFNSVLFHAEGRIVQKTNYDQSIIEFFPNLNKDMIAFLVSPNYIPDDKKNIPDPKDKIENKSKDENQNIDDIKNDNSKNNNPNIPDIEINNIPNTERKLKIEDKKEDKSVIVTFHVKEDISEFKLAFSTKINDIIETFTNKKGLDPNSLDFYYNEEKLDKLKTLEEIVNKNDKDKGKIDIIVKEKNIINSEKNNFQPNEPNNESCFKKNKKIILISIIAGVSLVILLVIILSVILIKKKKKVVEEQIEIIDEKNVTMINV